MTTKTIKQKGTTEDFLGLAAFGGLIANIIQFASKKRLEDQHENLKASAANLKRHYDAMIERYKQVSSAYLSMRDVNDALSKQTQTLNAVIEGLHKENNGLIKELDALREENMKLRGSDTGATVKKRKCIIKRRVNA